MAGGLAALLDDIATMARMAAASVDDVAAAAGRASAKAAGVVVDDTAVTPRYVTGFEPTRELPMIKRIAVGSLRNKLLFILPAALLLSQFAPWLLTPLLMVGGTYLSFEGAEKLWEKISGHDKHAAEEDTPPVAVQGEEQEKHMVASAIRTDFILSAEIMVIALNEVADQALLPRAIILVVVAIAITIGVYGVVALIVKMDDIGLHLIENSTGFRQRVGRGLVAAMPKVLAALSLIGMIAMLWVGGHILLVGVDTLGWHAPYAFVHHLEEAVAHATGVVGPFLGWLTNTFFSFLIGLAVGAVIVVVMHLIPRTGGKHAADPHPRASDLAE
ncbi:DUF808 domain-containing protein [Propioniciclava sp.]|uniref:DUF808 domain-containing protein n=1 Tax=Propioniciclava sp. TaxID=2038686 RepID=UPI0026362746|nr:DUF808 domain-containing protein [Propioniciclava sp.]